MPPGLGFHHAKVPHPHSGPPMASNMTNIGVVILVALAVGEYFTVTRIAGVERKYRALVIVLAIVNGGLWTMLVFMSAMGRIASVVIIIMSLILMNVLPRQPDSHSD